MDNSLEWIGMCQPLIRTRGSDSECKIIGSTIHYDELAKPEMTSEEDGKVKDNVSEVDHKDVAIEVVVTDDLEFEENCCSRVIFRVQESVNSCLTKNKKRIWTGIKCIILLLYLAYFGYCMYYRFGDEGSIRLLVGTCLLVLFLLLKLLPGGRFTCLKHFSGVWGGNSRMMTVRTWVRRSLYVLFLAGAGVYIGLEVVQTNPENTQALLGVASLILLCFLTSTSPARINWHTVFWGIGIQFVFAILILRTGWGYAGFDWLGHRIEEFLEHGHAGARFAFGASYRDHRLAFAVLPIMLFFNSVIFFLYHIGVIQAIIKTLGTFLAFCLDTGPVESVVAAANIFIGLTEAPLLVRPFLKMVTLSELHAIMTCGFASVSGGVLGTFVQFGVPANHLLSASVMSAPAALAVTKIMCPETKRSVFGQGTKMELGMQKHRNALSAISSGAVAAVKIAANTIANQIAFVSFLNFADMTLGWFGDRAGVDGMSFELVCSYLFFPISYVMGVAGPDCGKMAGLIGKKLFSTPIISYIDLGTMRNNRKALLNYQSQYNNTWSYVGGDILLTAVNQTLVGGVMQERSEVIGTYALCGFSTVTSIGVTLGTLVPLAPERKQDVVRLVIRALIAGNVASFLTGAIAGLLFDGRA